MIRLLTITALSLLTAQECDSKKAETKTQETVSSAQPTKQNSSSSSTSATPPKKVEAAPKSEAHQTNSTTSTKTAETSTKTADTSGVHYFNHGENRFLKEYQMNVTFNRITKDSRCPKGVNCIWEGVATAELTLMGTTTRPQTVTLSSQNNSAKGLQNYVEFNGYKITLVSVNPYPVSGSKISDEKYQIGITIVPAAATNTK